MIDDATGQLRMRLASSYRVSELGLGHLIQQSAGSARRGGWRGAGFEANTQGWASVRAANVDKRPVNLRLIDLPKVNQSGLDAVWQHGEQYTVTEAKARGSIGSAYGIGKMLVKNGKIPDVKGLSPDLELLHYLLSDYEDKRGGAGGGMMQMSRAWVRSRAAAEQLSRVTTAALENDRSDRRTVLVSFESQGAIDHAEALIDIHAGKPDEEVHPHTDHGITRAWSKAAIDAVDEARKSARIARPQTGPAKPSGTKSKPKR